MPVPGVFHRRQAVVSGNRFFLECFRFWIRERPMRRLPSAHDNRQKKSCATVCTYLTPVIKTYKCCGCTPSPVDHRSIIPFPIQQYITIHDPTPDSALVLRVYYIVTRKNMKIVTVVLGGGYEVGVAGDPAQQTLVFSKCTAILSVSFDGSLSVFPTQSCRHNRLFMAKVHILRANFRRKLLNLRS